MHALNRSNTLEHQQRAINVIGALATALAFFLGVCTLCLAMTGCAVAAGAAAGGAVGYVAGHEAGKDAAREEHPSSTDRQPQPEQ